MAAIDKIYLKYSDAKEFLDWAQANDLRFVEEFRESRCPSIMEFFYFKPEDLDEIYGDKRDNERPVCNLPTLVERWLMKQDIPQAVRAELYLNYGLSGGDESLIEEYIARPLEQEDPRPYGNRFKILSRTGCLKKRNFGIFELRDFTYEYYREAFVKKYGFVPVDFTEDDMLNLDEHTLSLLSDSYWRCDETGDIENMRFRKKKNIWTSKSSNLVWDNCSSLKSAIRCLRKHSFPVGTIFKISNWWQFGEIIIKVVK